MKNKKKQNIVPLKDLNLTDRFLFDEVLEDRETYQDVLSIIFGKEFLKYVEQSTNETANQVKSERVRRVHERVCKGKVSEEIGVNKEY